MPVPSSKRGLPPAFLLSVALVWALASVFATVNAVHVLRDPDADSRVLPVLPVLPVLLAVVFAVNVVVWGVRYLRGRRQEADVDQ